MVALGALMFASAASAQSRVVLATRDPALESALEAALAPWHVTLVVIDDAAPGAAMPSSADRGRTIAHDHDSVAVTWISTDTDGGTALWMYDRAGDTVVARRLPVAPPFDEPTADAVALSIKTMLRHSAAAPPSERILDPAPAAEWLLELGAGARALATSPGDVEARFTAGAIAFPRALGSIFGIGVVARTGLGVGLSHNGASGRLGDLDLAATVRARIPIAPIFDVAFGVELGASLVWIDATVGADAHHVMRFDLDPTGTLWAEAALRPISALRIAVRIGAFVSPITRSYRVRGTSVLDTQAVSPFVELLFDVPLDGGRVDLP